MRTTLTLDDDVAKLLEKQVRESGTSLKEEVNRLLRLGFVASRRQKELPPFVVTPLNLGLPEGLSYDNIGELLEAIEGEGRG